MHQPKYGSSYLENDEMRFLYCQNTRNIPRGLKRKTKFLMCIFSDRVNALFEMIGRQILSILLENMAIRMLYSLEIPLLLTQTTLVTEGCLFIPCMALRKYKVK